MILSILHYFREYLLKFRDNSGIKHRLVDIPLRQSVFHARVVSDFQQIFSEIMKNRYLGINRKLSLIYSIANCL